jgi:hypothetical protein
MKYYNPIEKGLWKDIIIVRYSNSRTTINISQFRKEINKELNIFNTSVNKIIEMVIILYFRKIDRTQIVH